MNPNSPTAHHEAAAENFRIADNFINEQARANNLHETANSKFSVQDFEAELTGGGQVKHQPSMMTVENSITNNPYGAPTETEYPSSIRTVRHENMRKVEANTERTSEAGTNVKYSGNTDAASTLYRAPERSAVVTRTYEDKDTGEEKTYAHAFKNPKAAKLITRLAAKRIERDNPIPASEEQSKAA